MSVRGDLLAPFGPSAAPSTGVTLAARVVVGFKGGGGVRRRTEGAPTAGSKFSLSSPRAHLLASTPDGPIAAVAVVTRRDTLAMSSRSSILPQRLKQQLWPARFNR